MLCVFCTVSYLIKQLSTQSCFYCSPQHFDFLISLFSYNFPFQLHNNTGGILHICTYYPSHAVQTIDLTHITHHMRYKPLILHILPITCGTHDWSCTYYS